MSSDTRDWRRARGAWSSLGDPWTAQALAAAGFTWVALDLQHGRWDDRGVMTALALIDPVTPVVVRVRSLDPGLIGRALDCGAAGIIVPMIQSVDDARAVVRAALYPPEGERSWGPLRGGYDGATTAAPFCAAMIETASALQDVESIAAVHGIDALFVGPFDLARALGTTLDELLDDGAELVRISNAARSAGIVAGAFAGTTERADRLAALGFEFLAATTEADLFARGADAID